jgi:hypothetical protein
MLLCLLLLELLKFGKVITSITIIYKSDYKPILRIGNLSQDKKNNTNHWRNEKKRRHEFSVHGFRKFFKTKAEIGGMKPINVETLMGHSIGISDSYCRPTEKELLEDYLNVIDHLVIVDGSRLKMELEQMNLIKEQEALNAEVIASLSDQLLIITTRLQELEKKNLGDYHFFFIKEIAI